MATRQELKDCLRDLVEKAVQDHQTGLALGREICVTLIGVLTQAEPTAPELDGLLLELKGEKTEVFQGLVIKTDWIGSRDDGELAISLKSA